MKSNGDIRPERALGLAVYLRTHPPHQGEFQWVLYAKGSGRIVSEGYARSVMEAVAAGEKRRMELWREVRKASTN